jgi:hypothetical protein
MLVIQPQASAVSGRERTVTDLPPNPEPSWAAPPAPPGYPAAPPPPPGYHGHPIPAAKPSSTNRTTLIAIGITLLIMVGLGCVRGLATAGQRANGRAPYSGQLGTGDCVRLGSGANPYRQVDCGDNRELGAVIAQFPGADQEGQSCPAETDLVLVTAGTIACVQSSTAEHLGRPGAGGGIIMAGDCVTVTSAADSAAAEYAEASCDSPKAYEKVTARAAAPAGCQPPAVRFMQLQTTVRPVVCLADGPGSAGVGECVGDPETVETFDAVPCAINAAKVLARRPTQAACEAVPGMTHWIEDTAGVPASRYVCLQELKR